MFNNRWILIFIRAAIGGAFIYAGGTKIQNPMAFADSIATFRMLPDAWINLLALTLPPFEVVIGTLMLIGKTCRSASLGVLLMTVLFAAALGQGIVRGLNLDCGCFGSAAPSSGSAWFSLGRDCLLFAGALVVYASSMKLSPEGHKAPRAVQP